MPDGSQIRDSLKAVERMTRKPVERLHKVLPDHWQYLWDWFEDLILSAPKGVLVSSSELLAWSSLKRVELTPLELELLRELNKLLLNPPKDKDYG